MTLRARSLPRHLMGFVLLPLVLGVQAAPDLSSRNALDTPWPAGAIATGGTWTAIAEKAWQRDAYDGAAVSDWDFEPYSATVLVTGPWDGSPVTTYQVATQLPGNQVFGESTGLAGNRLAVGAPSEGHRRIKSCDDYGFCSYGWQMQDPGQVYLYQFNGTSFALERSLTRGDGYARFGHTLALSSTGLLVGAPGANPGVAYLFDPNTGNELESFPSPAGATGDDFASVVALGDTLAVIGAPADNSVYVYEDSVAGWQLLATLTNPDTGARFGAALATDGRRVLVGAPGIDQAFIYELPAVSTGYLTARYSSISATKLVGPRGSDFGHAVALLADSAWVSSPRKLIDSLRRGIVRQYRYDLASGWTLADTLSANNLSPGRDDFGAAMAVSTDRLLITTLQRFKQYIFTSPANVYDPDGDSVGQVADNCPAIANTDQSDIDYDGLGDACDDDIDGDRLSNDEEAAIGTDPTNPDTDGDGLRDDRDPVPLHKDIDDDGLEDPDDNCPQAANPAQENFDGDLLGDACDDDIDNDSLANEDELAGGTDPFNKDSDGDGHEDDYDLFPADEHDGWNRVFRFSLPASDYVAVDGALALAASNGNVPGVQAYARVAGAWQPIAAPDLAALNASRIEAMALSRTTAAFVVQGYAFTPPLSNQPAILIYHWNPISGWVFSQDLQPPFSNAGQGVEELRLAGKLMAVVGVPDGFGPGYRGLAEIYKLQDGLYESSGSYATDGWGYQLEAQISGNKVFLGDEILFASNPTLHLLSDTGNIEASLPTVIQDSTSSSSCINPSNSPLISAGLGKLLLSTDVDDFWVTQSNSDGSLQLEQVAYGNGNIGGLGDFGTIGLEHPVPLTHPITGATTQYNLEVLSMADGRSLGTIPNRRDNTCWMQWDTDGLTVITASDNVVEIYPLDRDEDGVEDSDDNCRNHANPNQLDSNGNGVGDICEGVLPPGC